MIEGDRIRIPGRVIRGHGVAGGTSSSSPHPAGTISIQAPLFAEKGLDLSGFHLATLNISTIPWIVLIENPAFHFENVKWTELHQPESFDFIKVFLILGDRRVPGWGYRPTPETKAGHPQPKDVLEVIAPFIPEVHSEPELLLELNLSEAAVQPISTERDDV